MAIEEYLKRQNERETYEREKSAHNEVFRQESLRIEIGYLSGILRPLIYNSTKTKEELSKELKPALKKYFEARAEVIEQGGHPQFVHEADIIIMKDLTYLIDKLLNEQLFIPNH